MKSVDRVVERQGYYSRDGSLRSKRSLRVFSAKRGARAKKTLPAPTENPTEMLSASTQATGEPGWRSVVFLAFLTGRFGRVTLGTN